MTGDLRSYMASGMDDIRWRKSHFSHNLNEEMVTVEQIGMLISVKPYLPYDKLRVIVFNMSVDDTEVVDRLETAYMTINTCLNWGEEWI